VDGDPEVAAVGREAAGALHAQALLYVDEDLLVAGLVADEKETQPVVLHHLQRLAGHVGLGVARPGDPELAQTAGDRLGPRPVVGERVVVEELLLHLREQFVDQDGLGQHVVDAAGPVPVATDRLRPQAERAPGPASPPGVQRDVRVEQIPDVVVLGPQVPLVDRGHERKAVHIGQDLPVGVVYHLSVRALIAKACHGG
jgi:hypothetical protein